MPRTLIDAFNRVRHSPALKLVAGNLCYGAYLQSPGFIAAQCASGLVTLALNVAGERSRRYEFLTHALMNVASGYIALQDGITQAMATGLSNETMGKIGVAGAFIGWAASQFMKLRMDIKGIETADKKAMDPTYPCAVADVLAVGAFPPLVATNLLAVVKQSREQLPAEDAPVHNWRDYRQKHVTGMRLLAGGLAVAGVAGLTSGFGAAYAAAFIVWAWAYTGFEPKRNAALKTDYQALRAA